MDRRDSAGDEGRSTEGARRGGVAGGRGPQPRILVAAQQSCSETSASSQGNGGSLTMLTTSLILASKAMTKVSSVPSNTTVASCKEPSSNVSHRTIRVLSAK